MNHERLRVASLRMEPMEAIDMGNWNSQILLHRPHQAFMSKTGVASKPMGDKEQQLQEKCKVLLIPIVTTSLIEQKT